MAQGFTFGCASDRDGPVLRPSLTVLISKSRNFGERRAKTESLVKPVTTRIRDFMHPRRDHTDFKPEDFSRMLGGGSGVPGDADTSGVEFGLKINGRRVNERDWHRERIKREHTRYTASKEPPKGNLDVAEYRFWIGAEAGQSCFARCRVCRMPTYTREQRVQHHEHYKCSLHVVEATRTLDQNVCVMCEKKFWSSNKWGIPLCSMECVEKWMFHPQLTALWQRALAVSRPKVAKAMDQARIDYEREAFEREKTWKQKRS